MRIETIEATELTDETRRAPAGTIIPAPPGCTYNYRKLLAYKINIDGLTADLYLED